jgi:hypothetical protein
MHQSSLENMQACYERYIKSYAWPGRTTISVLDVGGANVNGTYFDIFSGPEFAYQSADIEANAHVDIVLDSSYELPFADESIDIVISGQVIEHVEFFWLLFAEMIRVLRRDGILILIAPSSGPIHRYPVDCYRFYPDAYRALAKLANCEVVEIIHDPRGPWKDLVGVFSKAHKERCVPKARNDWAPNRFELPMLLSTVRTQHTNANVETPQGSRSYLSVLEYLHNTLEPRLYLEIGVRNGNSLRLAHCQAIGVDPSPDDAIKLLNSASIFSVTSDEFFLQHADVLRTNTPPELVFIDGMHLFEFVLRDFINIERYSTAGTVVAVDDVFPNHRIQAQRLRNSSVWTGDVWKLGYCLAEHRPDLNLTYLDTYPTGMLIISNLDPDNSHLLDTYNPICRQYINMELQGTAEKEILQRYSALEPSDEKLDSILKSLDR